MTEGVTRNTSQLNDYQMCQKLSALIAQQATSKLPCSIVFRERRDLIGDDAALLGPLRLPSGNLGWLSSATALFSSQ